MDGAATRCGDMVGASAAMRRVFALIERCARSDAPVLVLGETGTGKELAARALHAVGPRAAAPFVALNCGALPAGLIESELFGHERGAFTGAHLRRTGAFEEAGAGTLFLDEIGELPLDVQARLLRALETGCVRRVGGAGERPYRARIVSATHRDLATEVAAGRFRADVFHRLAVLAVTLPPLRERREDVAPLARALLARSAGADAPPRALTPGAIAKLERHHWPGNVRELKNVLLRAVALVDGALPIDRDDLTFLASAPGWGAAQQDGWDAGGVAEPAAILADGERAIILDTMKRFGGNRSATARALGIARSTLREKLHRYREA